MWLFEDLLRSSGKNLHVAFECNREPMDGNAVDLFNARGIRVAPRDVVAGAGRQHCDLRVTGEMLGDVPCVQFSAAVDLGAVSLHNDCELHCSDGSGFWSSSDSSSPS